jgi:SAM-dependent methyltransferase
VPRDAGARDRSKRATPPYLLHYSHFHPDTPAHRAAAEAQHRRQLEPLVGHLPYGGRALDIGCATGFALGALGTLGFEAEGVERDPDQVAIARRNGHTVHESEALPEFLAVRPRTYDVVLMLDVLEHLDDTEQLDVLRGVAQALRPGGRLVLTVPNAIAPLSGYWRYVDFTHRTSFTKESLRFVVLGAGFASITFANASEPSRPSFRVWRRSAWPTWRRWAVRWVWKQMVVDELGREEAARALAFGPNLVAVADV